jgi:hypothetical protein
LIGAALVLMILAGVAVWALSQMDNPPISIGRSGTPTPTPAPTPAPTATRAPGLGINIPGPQGTPTTISIPLPIPGLGGTPGTDVPSIPTLIPEIPTLLPTVIAPLATLLPGGAIPGVNGTPPPNAKLDAEQARQKVKDSLSSCQVLQAQIGLAQVTFEAPVWHVRLPLTGTTWNVDDNSGEVTPDERAAERTRNCRL